MPNLIIKLNRLSAWLLVVLMILYFFTGFDSLKNIWNPEFSRYLHNKILPLPTLILVAFHTLVGLKLYLLRHLLENKFINYLLQITGLIIFLIFIYLFFR
jgi:succinate dehydrogenase hydrophobic anchor subunit